MPQYDAGSAAIKVKPSFRTFVTETETQLKRYDFSVDVRVGADTRVAAAEIAGLQRVARENQTFRVGADTLPASAKLAALRQQLREGWTIRPDVDAPAAARARTQVTSLARQLQRVGSVNLSILGVVGASGAVADLLAIANAAGQASKAISLIPAVSFAGIAGIGAAATGLSGIPAAFKAMSAASKDAATSASDQAAGLDEVAEAQYQAEQASRSARLAQASLNDAYKDASRSIRDMSLDLQGQKLSVADASLGVEEAAKRLNELRFDPTADSITRRRAQLTYEQAIQRLEEQKVRTQDLAEDTAEANAKGVEGSDQVTAAKQRIVEATHAEQRALAELNKERAGGSAAQDKLAQALAELSPNAREVVEDIRALGPAWTAARLAGQDALTEVTGPAITRLAEVQLPAARDGIVGINTALNTGLRGTITSLSGEVNRIDFRTSLANTSLAFTNAAQAARPLTDAVTKLVTVGTTFLPQFGAAASDAANRFNDFIGQAAADGSLRTFMSEGITATRELVSIMGNLGSSVASIFGAAAADGPTLAGIDALTQRWREFLRSTAGQDSLRSFFAEMREGADRLREALGNLPEIVAAIWDGFQTWAAIAMPFLNAAGALLASQPELVTAAVVAFLGFKTVSTIFSGVQAGINRTTGVLTDLQGRATGVVSNLRGITTATGGVANVAGVGATQLGRFGSAIQQAGTHAPAIARMQQGFLDAAAGANRFGRTAGTAAAAASGLRSAASGVAGVLGGPWGVALAAATISAIAISREVRKAAEQQDILSSSSRSLAIAQREVAAALQGTAGAVSNTTMSDLAEQIDNVVRDSERLADTAPGAFAIFPAAGRDIKGWFSGVAEAGTDALKAQEEIAETAGRVRDSLKETGLSAEEMARQVFGTDAEFAQFIARLHETGNGGKDAEAKIRELRQAFIDSQNAARDTTPGFFKLYEAIKVLGDSTKSSAERLNAMKDALDALSGKPLDAQQALAAYNDQLRATADLVANFNAAEGVGNALVKDGQIDTATANGRRLFDTLINIKEQTLAVAVAGGDLDARLAQNGEQFRLLAGATQLSEAQIRELAASIGLVPDQIRVLAKLENATTTQAQLVAIAEMIKANDGKPITIPTKLLTEEARAALAQWGIEVKAATNNPAVVTVAAKTDQALADLQAFANTKIPDLSAKVNVKWDFENPDPALVAALNTDIANTERRWTRADGGIVEAGPAAIANRPINQWAEAGPEAYIPLSPGKRTGAVPIWLEAGRQLGMVTPRAEGGIVESMKTVVASKFPGLQLTSGLRFTDDGYHSVGKAADFSNGTDSTPEMRSLAEWIATNYPQSLELIHQPFSRNIKDGRNVGDGLGVYGPKVMAEHRNHVHWAMSAPPSGAAAPSPSTLAASPSGPSLSVAPQAALPGRATDAQLRTLSGQAAVDSANSERNAVYANPNSTDQDRLGADIKYQQAQNALESAQKSTSQDTSSLSLQGIFSKAGSIIADGLLSGLGLENSILSSSNVYNRSLNTVIDFYGNKNDPTGNYSYQPKNLPATVPSSPGLSASTIDPSTSAQTPGAYDLGTINLGVPRTGYKAGGGAEQWRGLATQMLIREGFNPSQVDIMLAQIQSESGGNPSIVQQVQDVNSGGNEAVGLLQVIPGTFATYRDPSLPNDRTHPAANMAAALRYYRARYGTDLSTMWGQGHGYDQGGIANGIGLMLKQTIKPERVLNPRQTEVFESALPLLESIKASTWSSSRVRTEGFDTPALPGPRPSAPSFTTNINSRVADVDDLADLVERQMQMRAIGLSAALP